MVSIYSLKIGDWVGVHGDNKLYAQVYSLGHWNKHQEADFFQITAKSAAAESTIEATADHLLYVLSACTLKTIPASDSLVLLNQGRPVFWCPRVQQATVTIETTLREFPEYGCATLVGNDSMHIDAVGTIL